MSKNNWKITKKTLQEDFIKSPTSKSAFDFILDLFVFLLHKKSKEEYKQVRNAMNSDAFKTDAEKQFIEILPKLIVENRDEDIIKLIGLIRRSAWLHNWGTLKSYKTYLNYFVDFIEKFVTSTSKNKQIIIEIIKKFSLPSLTDEEDKNLSEAFDARQVFLHDKLQTKFKARLRRQDRTSGDKVWLPLNFIAKIFKYKEKASDFSKWLDKLVDGIYIHYMDDKGTFASVSFKSDVFLDFEKNNDGQYDVYVIWSKNQEPKRYRVYTPTGQGNKKEPMTVKDISEIDIDHIKPIDITLRELDEKGKLRTLKIVSDAYKQLLEDTTNHEEAEEAEDLEQKAIETTSGNNDFIIEDLLRDLNDIMKDGLLRLMDSSYNVQKSNGITFEGGILKNENKYMGILGNALGDNNEKITIYQKLEENGITRATSPDNIKGRKVKISKAMIDLL